MPKSKWIKLGASSVLSMGILAACAEEEPAEEEVVEEEPVEEEVVEEEPIEEEVVEEEPVEEEEEEPVEEEVVEEEPIEEEVVEEEPLEEEVDFGAIDEVELEDEYLDPLGWTAVEFEDYVVAEYDMALADFADFAELEETVGPVEEIVAAEEGVELGAVAFEDLDATYLDPLGWSIVEFNDYVVAEYDTAIADFADFAELKTTVGPVEDILVAEEDVDLGAIAVDDVVTTYLDPLAWSVVEFEDYIVAEYDMTFADFADFAELEETVGPVEEIDPNAIEDL
ncbi:hypothetical protein [Planococcus lenghuensis]|uniref:hypothetical protein n=1 Tax=Planococcus lenghuensis TaxID=2213202 RepID=UPI0018DE1ADC|nr:hypothetical protein [Planococcus lenghuensis]